MMFITIRYLNILCRIRGVEEELLELREGSTGEDLIEALSRREEKLSFLLQEGGLHPSLHLYQGGRLLSNREPLSGEEVTLVLALAGG